MGVVNFQFILFARYQIEEKDIQNSIRVDSLFNVCEDNHAFELSVNMVR